MDKIIKFKNIDKSIKNQTLDLLDDSLNIDLKEELINNISSLNEKQLKELNKIAECIEKGQKGTFIPDDYKQKDKRRFVKMYIEEVNELLMKAKSINDMKVLLFLMKKMNYDTGEIIVPNAMISDELKMDKSLVSKSLKNLINDSILLIKEGYEKKKFKIYLLNEKYFKYGR